MIPPFTLLIVAKAPVAGQAKTRLQPRCTPVEAAGLAAAALLDTLATARAVPAQQRVVALTGTLADAERGGEIARALQDGFTVVGQRGRTFADRLAAAHLDAANLIGGQREGGPLPIVQIGMDTPQATSQQLLAIARNVARPRTALVAPALDGGWWALGLHDPRHADVLAEVPMSEPHTGAATVAALLRHRLRVRSGTPLRDVDHPADISIVASECAPSSEFARAARQLAAEARQ
ncbi:TIGR04282 family arsenosugar biosynthesis glycosyltransferase [Lolliginicoccus suaedae]|uniref:TIGR04282 family arsenosugar biosynthesis glycosyltransferase n=1 Tax=Lolliginicoccus suaedae TaxID=2605429 RepID=UPI0011EE4C93|nr:DUF2064 domain-containing protein [Lolliginicoccus suaedae]